jgi:hypothetical protein
MGDAGPGGERGQRCHRGGTAASLVYGQESEERSWAAQAVKSFVVGEAWVVGWADLLDEWSGSTA